ncbi:MAG: hypothetical protein GY811_10170 [Myxococcales bacterium]|nr:hypothetical protein [Myxococcales bacterium]
MRSLHTMKLSAYSAIGILGAAAAVAVLLLYQGGKEETQDMPSQSPGIAGPEVSEDVKPTAAKTDSTKPVVQASLDQVLYLHHQASRAAAVLNHVDTTPHKTSIVSAGDSLLGGTVFTVSSEEVLVDHPSAGRVSIPFLGIKEAAPPIQRPFEARYGHIAVTRAPSFAPREEAATNAEQEVYKANREARGGGKGRGPSTGPGSGTGSGGGKGRKGRKGQGQKRGGPRR